MESAEWSLAHLKMCSKGSTYIYFLALSLGRARAEDALVGMKPSTQILSPKYSPPLNRIRVPWIRS